MVTSLAIGLVCSATAAFAETMYVQAKTAQLRAGKTSLDAVVASVKFGDSLEVVGRDGAWVEVKTSVGARGWIYNNKLSSTKPSGSSDALAKLGQSMRGGDASATTASAGARGLDKASEGYANRTGISPKDREAVDRMTSYQIPDQEVEDFLREGGLGEYAK
jgi:uncharacterized protein YgiM (DUF1202 family)